MKTIATFTSDRFKPFLPDDSQVNPQCYGAELAWWLSRKLAESGVVTSYPEYEDWGWFIEYITADGDEFWLCCGNVDGSDNRWHLFLDPKGKGLFGRRRAAVASAQALIDALRALLSEDRVIVDLEWEGHDTD